MASGLGKYLYNPYSYLAITKTFNFMSTTTRMRTRKAKRPHRGSPGKAKYIFRLSVS
jgi:hypothetical protein